MSTILELQDLHRRFGGIQAVRGVSFGLREGELLGLFGPNGAGKTTVFNLIAGTFRPNSGRVKLDGRDVTALPAGKRARAGIARTFQVCRPFRGLTVLENLLAAVPRDGAGAPHGVESARQLLADVGLGARADEPAERLTLGMLKRLEVARALATEPRLLLLDEPLAGLSAGETRNLLDFVASLTARTSVVLIDHNVRQSLTVCERAVVMDAGAVICEGTPDDVRNDPAVRRAYLGGHAA